FVSAAKRRWRHGSLAGYRRGRTGFSFAPTQLEKRARSRCTARAYRPSSTGAACDKSTAMPSAAALVLRASLVPSAVRTFHHGRHPIQRQDPEQRQLVGRQSAATRARALAAQLSQVVA